MSRIALECRLLKCVGIMLYTFWAANLTLYPHSPSTNQRTASQLSLMLKLPSPSLPEENSKPRLSDPHDTTNRLHASPQTVKYQLTPSPSKT
ncbi:hypothetical protein TNCV_725081 [Trichonephila clavipes]|nr:hypothetical protein TNCV_725081 [Trichonephila clavipes]